MKKYGIYNGFESKEESPKNWQINISGSSFSTTLKPHECPPVDTEVVFELNDQQSIVSIKNAPKLPEKVRGRVKVAWVNLNEGFYGDYDPEDPRDRNFLRFDLYYKANKKSGWEEVSDGSYRTQLKLPTQLDTLEQALDLILDAAHQQIEKVGKAKRICESLSWMNEKWVKHCVETKSLMMPGQYLENEDSQSCKTT